MTSGESKKITTIDKKPEIRTLTPVEASWLAAAIDGEGTIGLYNYGKEGRRVVIAMGNTDENFVLHMRKLIGCGSTIFRTEHPESHKGRKPMYIYSLKGSCRCYWVLKQIAPYLIIKKNKALAIINELETKPFGRWANATPENKQKQSERMRTTWADPKIRARRLLGMAKKKEMTKCKKQH